MNASPSIASVSYNMSLDYYRQFCAIMQSSMIITRWLPIVWVAIWALVLMLCGEFIFGSFLVISDGYLIWNEIKGFSPTAIYNSCKIMHGLYLSMDFYENIFIYTDKFGSQRVPYEMLYSIKSSKYGYALLTSKGNGYFVPKGVCSNELISFIENLKNDK